MRHAIWRKLAVGRRDYIAYSNARNTDELVGVHDSVPQTAVVVFIIPRLHVSDISGWTVSADAA